MFLLASPLWAEDWPRWRGPGGSAVSAEAPLPVEWSQSENVRWKTAIPGEGSSSPVVWGERVFVTSALKDGTRRATHCLDRASGKLLWSREIADDNPERTSAVTGHAAPTPATDGRHIVAFFGNAGAVCYDPDGKQLWHRRFGEFDTELGIASSPVIDGERVYLVCDHDGSKPRSFDSFLVALDVRTGKELWRAERRGLERSWATPILVPVGDGKRLLIVAGQDHLRAYDPATGKERWKAEGLMGWVAPSPVFGGGLVFATSGKNGPVLALRPRAEKAEVVWKRPTGGPYVCSPLLYGDYLYVHTEFGVLTCFDAKTGKERYRERLEGKFTASGVAGDGKLYLTNEAGTTFVLKAGPEFEVLARNKLGEYSVASPAVSGGCLFLRTDKHVWCVGPAGKR